MRRCLFRDRVKLVSAYMRPLLMMTSRPSASLPKVVVVGAGFAGLSAAKTLQQSQRVDVLVLEASQRVSSRMVHAGSTENVQQSTLDCQANKIAF